MKNVNKVLVINLLLQEYPKNKMHDTFTKFDDINRQFGNIDPSFPQDPYQQGFFHGPQR